jgi:hypothetical protein
VWQTEREVLLLTCAAYDTVRIRGYWRGAAIDDWILELRLMAPLSPINAAVNDLSPQKSEDLFLDAAFDHLHNSTCRLRH